MKKRRRIVKNKNNREDKTLKTLPEIVEGQKKYQRFWFPDDSFIGDSFVRLMVDPKDYERVDVEEEDESYFSYPSGYKPKGIAEQIKTLCKFFPCLNGSTARESIAEKPFPAGAEGWFAIPRREKIAPTYNEAVKKVLAAVKTKCKGSLDNRCRLGSKYLRQTTKTARMFQKLGDKQKGHDILIVPAQFGFRHRGRCVYRVRRVINASEFGLGAFAVGIMILTHPERLPQDYGLQIDCAGDAYSPDGSSRFEGVPVFGAGNFYEIEFENRWFVKADGQYGSASGFVSPQYRTFGSLRGRQ